MNSTLQEKETYKFKLRANQRTKKKTSRESIPYLVLNQRTSNLSSTAQPFHNKNFPNMHSTGNCNGID
jgi:hypothetical protein